MNTANIAKLDRISGALDDITIKLETLSGDVDDLAINEQHLYEQLPDDVKASEPGVRRSYVHGHLQSALDLLERAVTGVERAREALQDAKAEKACLYGLTPQDGDELLIFAANQWGKGKTVAEARTNLQWSLGDKWIVFSVDPSTYVDDMGSICRDQGTHEPVELRRSF